MQKFIAFADRLSIGMGQWISYLVLPMIAVIVFTAVLRYFFNIAVDWGFEVSVFIYGVHCLMGGCYTMALKGHIAVDSIPRRLPVRWQKYIEIISFTIVIAVCLVAAWQGSMWAWKSTKIWERSIHQTVFNPPIWWFKWTIPISAALIIIQSLAEMFKVFMNLPALKREP